MTKLYPILLLLTLFSCGANRTISQAPKDGASSIIISTPITTPCVGVQFSTFLDRNNNGIGEPFELTSQYNICSLIGPKGEDGTSVIFDKVPATSCDGYTILFASDVNYNEIIDAEDKNMQSITLCNGKNGTNGLNGKDAVFTPVSVVNPCGDAPNVIDEVFLRIDKNTIVAYYEDGGNRRLAVLEENVAYTVTDGDRACKFKILNGEVVKI